MKHESDEPRSLPITPTWSVAIVLTLFVAVSLSVERSIHRLSSWLRKTNRKPLFEALERMKEELMLLGFMSLLLTATSRTISSICIDKKFYGSNFAPCSKSEIEKSEEDSHEDSPKERKLLMASALHQSLRRGLIRLSQNTCKRVIMLTLPTSHSEIISIIKLPSFHPVDNLIDVLTKNHEPFVSLEGLEQLHRFIFVMAVTHITYSCLTMLLAIIKVHSWRSWEDEAHIDRRGEFPETARESTIKRQSLFVKFHLATPWGKNGFFVWVTCFFRQFANSVVRADYLTLRMGFIKNHNLSPKYDFHSYMIRTMEEEFQRIVGVSGPLWGFVVAFMLFNVKGSNLYFWIAVIPTALVLALGTKLQRIIATLAWENAGVTGFFTETRLKPRDELFWFNKPELILSFIHFVLFQNAFEMASFLWFWWQFGYHSCFNSNHPMLYTRLIVGLASQFLCSYSTLPLYALVTQMGTNYKAAMIPESVRETIHGWNKATKKKRRRGNRNDDSTVHTETSTVISFDDDESQMCDSPTTGRYADIELAPISTIAIGPRVVPNEGSSRVGTPLLKSSGSNFSSTYLMTQERSIIRSPSRSPPAAVQRRGPME